MPESCLYMDYSYEYITRTVLYGGTGALFLFSSYSTVQYSTVQYSTVQLLYCLRATSKSFKPSHFALLGYVRVQGRAG